MKKMIFLLTLVSLTLSMNAKKIKESEIPEAVKSLVLKNYPNAENKYWKYKDKDDTSFYYKVEFEVDGRDVELEIDQNGKLISSEEELAADRYPEFIKKYVNKNFSGAEFDGIKSVVKDGRIYYDAGIRYQNQSGYKRHQNIYFDPVGNILKY